jgi:hypothetical protein
MGGTAFSSAIGAPVLATGEREQQEDRALLSELARKNAHYEITCPDCMTKLRGSELVRHYDEHHAWERLCQPLEAASGRSPRSDLLVGIAFSLGLAFGILRAALGRDTLWGAVLLPLSTLSFVVACMALLRSFLDKASLEDAGNQLILRRSLGRSARFRLPVMVQSVGDMTTSAQSNVTNHLPAGMYLRMAFSEKTLIVNCRDEDVYTFHGRWDPSLCIVDRSLNLGSAHIRLTREDFYALQLWLRQHGALVPNPLSLRKR